MNTQKQGLVHRVRHHLVDPALERIVGAPHKVLTVNGDSFELKVRTVHYEGAADDHVGNHYVLILGEALDHGRRFEKFGKTIAHCAFVFSTREYTHDKQKFCIGVARVRLGGPTETWLDPGEKTALFEELFAWERGLAERSLFERLTGVIPEAAEKGSPLRQLGQRFSLVHAGQ